MDTYTQEALFDEMEKIAARSGLEYQGLRGRAAKREIKRLHSGGYFSGKGLTERLRLSELPRSDPARKLSEGILTGQRVALGADHFRLPPGNMRRAMESAGSKSSRIVGLARKLFRR